MEYLWLSAIPFVTAGAGAYFGSYLKTKGANLATHEDINKLVDQVQAVTAATKKIEAEISGDLWSRQKRWELKREVLFEGMRRSAEIEAKLLSLGSMFTIERKENRKEDDHEWAEFKGERLTNWNKAFIAFRETKLFVTAVCSQKTIQAFDEFATLASETSRRMKDDPELYKKSQPEWVKMRSQLNAAIRHELGLDDSA